MFISIGRIVNTHGNKGEVKIKPLTDDLNRYSELEHVYLIRPDWEAKSQDPSDRQYVSLAHVRYHKDMVLITFNEVADMNQAEALKGYFVQLPEADLKPLPEGRYYIYQLIGLQVYEGQTCYGTLIEVLQPGSNDVYVVQDAGTKEEILVPALKDVIKKVDVVNGRMEVVLPLGLLD